MDKGKLVALGGAGCCTFSFFPFLVGILIFISILAFVVTGSSNDSDNASNSGKCYDVVYTNIVDEDKYADAINKGIKELGFPNSPWLDIPGGPGKPIVETSKKYDVNPLLTVCIGYVESGMGVAASETSHNSFGRMAASGQPSYCTNRCWYRWPSWLASLNADDSQPQFLSTQYIHDGFKFDTLEEVINTYCPWGDGGNNPDAYVNTLKKNCFDKINNIAGDAISCD